MYTTIIISGYFVIDNRYLASKEEWKIAGYYYLKWHKKEYQMKMEKEMRVYQRVCVYLRRNHQQADRELEKRLHMTTWRSRAFVSKNKYNNNNKYVGIEGRIV